jgi:hypothetical protein
VKVAEALVWQFKALFSSVANVLFPRSLSHHPSTRAPTRCQEDSMRLDREGYWRLAESGNWLFWGRGVGFTVGTEELLGEMTC